MSEAYDDAAFTDFLRGRDTPEARSLLDAHPMLGLARLALLAHVSHAANERLESAENSAVSRIDPPSTASSSPAVYARAASSDTKDSQPDSSWIVQGFQVVRSHPNAAPIGLTVALVTRPERDDVFVRVEGHSEGARFVAWIPASPDDMPTPPREAIMQRPTVSGLVPLHVPEGVRPELTSDLRLAVYLGGDLDPTSILWLTRGG